MLENNFKMDKPPLPEDISFNFTPEEIREMQEKGVTDEEIEKKRRDVLNRIERARSTKH